MFLKETFPYSGHLIHHRFAFRYFNDAVSPLGNLLVFRGPMEVTDAMIDLEDVLKEAFIYAEDALNFVWEIPLLGNSPFGAVSYQRLFNTLLAETLSEKYLKKPIKMHGDDLLILKGSEYHKLSVSITHVKEQAALGHTGINLTAGKRAPSFAYSTQLTDKDVTAFAEDIIKLFNQLNQDIFTATTKVL